MAIAFLFVNQSSIKERCKFYWSKILNKD